MTVSSVCGMPEGNNTGRICGLPGPHPGNGHIFEENEIRPLPYGETVGFNQWWQQLSASDWLAFSPKLREYGAHDLEEHGRLVARFRGPTSISNRVAGELGCLVYLHGKLARAMEAYQNGEIPSDDTLHDIEVYAKMARAYRERGGLK